MRSDATREFDLTVGGKMSKKNDSHANDPKDASNVSETLPQAEQSESAVDKAHSIQVNTLQEDADETAIVKSAAAPGKTPKRKRTAKKAGSKKLKSNVTANEKPSLQPANDSFNDEDLERIAQYISRIADGDLELDLDLNTENAALKKVHAAITKLISSTLSFTNAMQEVSAGKLEVVETFRALGNGKGKRCEKDHCSTAFIEMVTGYEEKSTAANEIAIGNFEVAISPKGHEDTLGHALVTLQFQVENLLSALSYLSEQTETGQINERLDLNYFERNWTDIASAVNLILDTLVGHIDAMPLPVLLTDEEHKILYVNDNACRAMSIERESVLGVPCNEIVNNPSCSDLDCVCSKVMISGAPETGEIELKIGDATKVYKAIASPLRNRSGEIKGTLQFLMDETSQRTVQNQVFDITQQIDQMVHQLAASASEAESQALAIEGKTAGANDLSHELTKQVKLIAESTESSQSSMASVSTASEEMAATVGEIAQNAERARAVTSNAVDAVDDASGEVNQLEQAAVQISNVTETIVEIAEQTKLLALNATIEAARAGEAGKGFAVVASEVKELAQQTNSATSDIRSKIDAIQNATRNTIKKIHNIADVMNEVNEFVSTIATATEEQAITTRDITETLTRSTSEMGNVSNAVTELTTFAQNLMKIVEDVTIDTSDIKQTSSELSRIAHELEQTESVLVNAIQDLN